MHFHSAWEGALEGTGVLVSRLRPRFPALKGEPPAGARPEKRSATPSRIDPPPSACFVCCLCTISRYRAPMLFRVRSAAVLGIDAYVVDVEVDIAHGLPSFATVGLPHGAVKEGRERVNAAITNSGYSFPLQRITVNLAPADVRKDGSAFDLPVALGVLAATGQLAASLHEVVEFLANCAPLPRASVDRVALFNVRPNGELDLADVRGQEHAKRALEVAAAGGHNLLMVGPPGSGKTMLARRLPTILPEMNLEEALETTKIHSVAGMLPPGGAVVTARPFRAPHHTISDAGLIGGGSHPRPGEVSLAHGGVLFLDELPEFRKNVLEVLRQPMEDGFVTIARAATSLCYPARFMLAGAMNPCPCGYYGDPGRTCSCGDLGVERYLARVSGPLLDRVAPTTRKKTQNVYGPCRRSGHVQQCSSRTRGS